MEFDAKHTTLGFIGLGHMGSRIVRKLIAAGYKTQIYGRQTAQIEALAKAGAASVPSLQELAQKSDVVLSCVTDDAAVRSIYADETGILQHARPGTVILEMSTIAPDTSREIASLGTERGIHVLDVAISGSTVAAERGELILFAGGSPVVFEAAQAIVRPFSKKCFHLGPSGAGTTMKLVVNAILGIGMQAIAEASALGQKAGLNRKVLLEVLSQTTVIAPAHLGKLERAARNEFSPQFPLPLMNKDFRLILGMAAAANASVPATGAAYEVNSAALRTAGEKDFSFVMSYMEGIGEKTPAAHHAD